MKRGTKIQYHPLGFDEKGQPRGQTIDDVDFVKQYHFQEFMSVDNKAKIIALDTNGLIKMLDADLCKVDSGEIKNQALLG